MMKIMKKSVGESRVLPKYSWKGNIKMNLIMIGSSGRLSWWWWWSLVFRNKTFKQQLR